ncbi:zinc finger protein [Macleaya cordata]|uniref:Zinc finger protein n=1 Tax=Macleaya cordata TaxID=56857 RepID=A0A200QE17_MACCD|nr:zinc finger protein [Macleaya cordata]
MKHLMNPTGFKKRKRGERVFRFRNFCEPGHPVEFNGPFRDNIRKLLEFARVETKLCEGMNSWSFQLELHRHPPVCISLFVIEEQIEKSVSPHCHYCQYVGWGHHMICNARFHFVVPSKETAVVMTVCSSYESNDNGRLSTMTAEMSNFIELRSHLLHGVLHSNGFGHLISINGIEKGSKLAGNEIMDLWDRICTGLRARKVSVIDIAKKRSMDLRLIHGVAFGEPWFGRWGYRFGRGSFGVTLPMYQKAIEAVQSIPLCLFIQSFASSYQEILVIFTKYQSISGNSLLTLGHIFRFMQELKDRLPPEICHLSSSNNTSGITVAETTCRWSTKRVEMATRVIIEALMKAEFRWVSRQEVRDAARAYIGDTGLLDFVLKSLGNQIVGNFVVRRTVNPVTKVLEYCLEDISTTFREGFSPNDPMMKSRYQITRTQLMKDLFYLYKFIFTEPKPSQNGGLLSVIPIAVRIILDSKYLIKDYKGELFQKTEVGNEENLKLLCTVSLKKDDNVQEIERIKKALEKPSPYDDLIILPPHATFRELKMEVERSFKEMYWGLKSFVAESVLDLNQKESDLVFSNLVEPSGFSIVVSGRIVDKEIDIEGMFEGKNQNLIIDCPCGAKEDDGERMIACDICEVRQHMRCVQITNMENIPDIFLCNRCEHDIVLCPDLP